MPGYRHPDAAARADLIAPHNSPGIAKDRMLDTRGLADLLGVSTDTIKRLRQSGTGPRYITIGGQIRYAPWDIRAWCDANSSTGGEKAK